MNKEQLNMVADIFNESKAELIKKGELLPIEGEKEEVIGRVVSDILASFSCYLYVYKDLYPDTYETAKNVLQNIADLVTIGLDVETCQPMEGQFSAESQHLIYLGDGK